MGPRTEIHFSFGLMILLNAGLAFGAIGLFGRMAPAIDRIRADNVSSIRAIEDMMVGLAAGARGGDTDRALGEALGRISENANEAEESATVAALRAELSLYADPSHRQRIVRHLQQLSRINHDAMARAGRAAQRLGRAGAWAAVWVGLLSCVLSLGILARLRQRLVMPIEELYGALTEVRSGNPMRRCRTSDMRGEVRAVLQEVNALLDRHGALTRREDHTGLYRLAMVGLIEQLPQAAAVLDHEDNVICANTRMLEALAGDHGSGLRMALAGNAAPQASPEVTRSPLPKETGWLCLVAQDAAQEGSKSA